jgi:[acyl-carrier-protein] S-malonyltransferase
MELSKEKGAKLVKKLEVSVPSHCLLMKSASEKLSLLLDNINFKSPTIPVIHNSDASVHQDSSSIKQALSQQLYSPVRWVECMEKIVRDYKVENIIECGPGKILTGLSKRILNIPASSFKEAINRV